MDKDFFKNLVEFNDLNEMESLIKEFSISEEWILVPKGKKVKFLNLTWLLVPSEKTATASLYYIFKDKKTGKESDFKVFQAIYLMDKDGHLMI